MLRFFSKIRYQLAAENRAAKYLRYAIGEILLVVVGILLALQVNNWNQQRIAFKEELIILKNIHSEFLENKKSLEGKLAETNMGFQSSIMLMNLIGKHEDEIKKYNTDSLLFSSLESGEFKFSENTISDLLQSGRLQLLHNEKLINLLYEWSSTKMAYYTSNERVNLKIDNELVPYLQKKYPLRDIDMYGNLKWKNKTLLKTNKLQIFEDIEFENIMDDYLYRINGSRARLEELEIIIAAIIKETEND
jgi:hypothetical protein